MHHSTLFGVPGPDGVPPRAPAGRPHSPGGIDIELDTSFADDDEESEIEEIDTDLDAEITDLPVARSRSAPPATPTAAPAPGKLATPLDDLDLPAPVGQSPIGLGAGRGSVDELDLPMPLEVDLPTPAGLDLPVALDLPSPLDDLPIPTSNLPAPASVLPRAAPPAPFGRSEPAPSLGLSSPIDDLDLEDLPPEPVSSLSTSHGAVPPNPTSGAIPMSAHGAAASAAPSLGVATGAGQAAPAAAPEVEVAGAIARPYIQDEPVKPAKPGLAAIPPRLLAYGAAGIGVLVLGVVGLWMSGLLGGEEPPPPAASVTPPPGGAPPVAPPPSVPAGEAKERAENVMAKLAEDSPTGYQQAQALAEQAGDVFGQAESALLSHLRYGPNAEAFGLAEGKLVGAEIHTEAHAKRVLGLAKLAAGDHSGALGLFDGQDARSRLYASWAYGKLGNVADAKVAAQAAAAARPDDAAAALEVIKLELLLDTAAGLTKLETWVDAHPEHLAAHEALVETLLELGMFNKATTRLDKLPSTANTSADHQAGVLLMRGRLLLARGKTSAALTAFEQSIAIAPASLAPQLARLDLLLEAKDLTALRRDLVVLVNDRGKERDVIAFAAKSDLANGELDRALGGADALVALNADDPDAPWTRARVADIRGNVEEARSGYASARDKAPGDLRAVRSELEMLRRLQRENDALALLDALLAASTGEDRKSRRARARLHTEKAQLLVERGELDPAKLALDAALEQDPYSNDALMARGSLRLRTGDYDGAEADLRKVFETTGGYPGLASPLGRVLLRKGDLTTLEQVIGSELEDELAALDILLTGAALKIRQGKYEDAIKLADRVLSRSSESWEARLVKGQALLRTGDVGGALAELEQAKPKEPNAEVELWMGQAFEYSGRTKEAMARYKLALSIEPGLDEAAALYGRQLAYAGSANEAISLLQPVVERSDAYPYAWVAIGIARRDLGRAGEAIAAFDKALEFDAKQFEALYWKGRILHDRNEHAKAEDTLAAAVAIATPETPYLDDAYRRLGNSRWALDKQASAREAYAKYLEVAPADAAGRAEVVRRMKP